MKHPYPSNIHIPFVTGVTNDNSSLTEKNILKIKAELSALESYVDCEFSALTSKIDIFSDAIKNDLSDLHTKEHKNSQSKVLKKNITLLQNEKKIKGNFYRIITRNTYDRSKHLSGQMPELLQSLENRSQRQLRQHPDHYQHHRQHQQQYPQRKAQQHLQQSQESNLAAQKRQQSSSFRRNNPPHQNKPITLYIENLSDDTTVSNLYELSGLCSTRYLSGNSDIQTPLLGNRITGTRRGFAYMTVPEHVFKELLKLHDVEFNGRKLVI